MQATTIQGVFAAGDLSSPMPNATLAAAAGVLAGGAAHRSLVFDPDLGLAAHSPPREEPNLSGFLMT